MAIIECVPNFSEGGNLDTIAALRDAVCSVSSVTLMDYSADPFHNRSVFSFLGTAESLQEAVMRAVSVAAKRIDMRTHKGTHPCIGAADVIPFIPIKDTSMKDCVALAQNVGEAIADTLSIPVYLYGEAARCEAHRNLADLRRGGYEKLAKEIMTVRKPDFGPCILGSAGASAVGARDILIAYNIYLSGSDAAPAKKIARLIRESNGGLEGIKALGMMVNGMPQVSINITNYQKTSMKTVFDTVKDIAKTYDCKVLFSELIGLVPKDALSETSADALMIRDFSEKRILDFWM